jgi:glutamate:Na+ symporter, ESS family
MNSEWAYVIDVAVLSLFLGIATYLKRTVGIFRKFLIPNSIIAGFLGLIVGPGILNLIDIDAARIGNIVYHLMAVGFISLALKERTREKNKDITNTGILIVSTYLIQGIIGFALTLVLAYTVFPDLFPPFGLLLPLGYGQGPGQAFSIGAQWEALGFLYGGNIGLSIAAFGFLWACLGGIPFMNILIRKKKFKYLRRKAAQSSKPVQEEDSPDDIPLSESIDRISIQLFLIGIVYLATYLTLQGSTLVLKNFGNFGQTLSQLLWGFNFIIGSLYAILFRLILDKLKKKNVIIRNYPNNYLLQRIAGGSFDFMITAAISGISISILRHYLVPTLLVTTVGGFLTMFYLIIMCKKVYKNNTLENIIGMYGMMTGTISTGMALLKELDPNFETGVAKNLVLGSGMGLLCGFPLMILLTIPIMGFTQNKPVLYFLTLLLFIVYLGFLFLLLYLNRNKSKT